MNRELREHVRRARSDLAFAELEAAGGYWRQNGHREFYLAPIEARERAAEREMLRAIEDPPADVEPGRPSRRCANPDCGVRFEPVQPHHRYHSARCSNTHRTRIRRAKARGLGEVA